MQAEIIAVGSEILLGQIVNTNARFLSEELAYLGIDVFFHTVVGDNPARIRDVFTAARSRSQLVIFTGGLGPTADDLTKETVAEALGLDLHVDEAWKMKLEQFFQSLNRPMPTRNIKQALVPEGSRILFNHHGTAPGIILEHQGLTVIMLPGPPRELIPMFRDGAAPFLREKAGGGIILSRNVKIVGMGESWVEEQVADLVKQTNPTVAPLVHNYQVHLRITAKGALRREVEALIDDMDAELTARLGPYIYGRDHDTLPGVVGAALRARGKTLGVAESCTGGRLGDAITNAAGSSDYFLGGVVAYSNTVKEKTLGVGKKLLEEHGAVSEETACAMAGGAGKLFGSDFSLAVTGIAGPQGSTPEKPVGLVYVALAAGGSCRCRKLFFHGKREAIKERTVIAALDMLRKALEA